MKRVGPLDRHYVKKPQIPHCPASNSQESARSTVRSARRVVYVQDIFSSVSELLRDWSSEGEQEGELSKTCVRGGVGA